jgi:cell wall-associated NlpC family hydrolase
MVRGAAPNFIGNEGLYLNGGKMVVDLAELQTTLTQTPETEWVCLQDINLYQAATGLGWVTQAAAGRQFRVVYGEDGTIGRIGICLCDDDYPGWLDGADLPHIAPAPQLYTAPDPTPEAIHSRLPAIVAFAQRAMACPNHYQWGGTVAPHYDCSGLIQAACRSVGLVVPRDAYQQETFVQPVAIADLAPGDLLFFGEGDRITHVALYLGAGRYIHSSGQAHGRNGIGIDSLEQLQDAVSAHYHRQLRSGGRITRSYQPHQKPWPRRDGQPFFPLDIDLQRQ